MKKSLHLIIAVFLIALTTQQSIAQCYQVMKVSDVVYSTANARNIMDVYMPVGAPAGKRPLLVMAHGGSFSGGSKDEGTSSEIARRFASRGFTTASINYRLETSTFNLVDSSVAAGAVIRAVSDLKAAVRFFTKDAATSDLYFIDTAAIYIGGNSAGAIAAVNYAYLLDTNDIKVPIHQYVRDVVRNNGGVEGNSGNAGYYDKVKGVLNFAGGVKDTAWIKPGSPKIFSAHGDKDKTVPYYFDKVLNSLTQNGLLAKVITLCGSGAMKPKLDAQGIPNVLKTYVNADHVPWEADTDIFDEIDSLSAVFLGAPTCYQTGLVSSLNDVKMEQTVTVYPNPANTQINISGLNQVTTITLSNQFGQVVSSAIANGLQHSVDVSALPKGVYFLKTEGSKGATQVNKVSVY